MSLDFGQIEAVIMDMDGVLWRGDARLPHVPEFIAMIQQRGIGLMLATNNSGKHPRQFVEKLGRMDVQTVPESAIITSGTATADYLRMTYGEAPRIHLIGETGLHQVLTEANIHIMPADAPAQDLSAVVVGIDFEFTYAKARRAMELLLEGVPFVVTNPDTSFPTPNGLMPGAGSIAHMISAASEVTPTIIGKPAPAMFHIALKRLGTSPQNTLMIGDRLNTDIEGAHAVGLPSALVLTGISSQEDVNHAIVQPDIVCEDLGTLMALWA